ncbi:Protein disulfide-isomerase 5-4 (AtPDIL5-4) (Protein disulfide-isomerase 7) (PDI7) (Protein disulfide-isomerase 8-2) (AtPDIL8-2), partial [Durusdinium trenchii]
RDPDIGEISMETGDHAGVDIATSAHTTLLKSYGLLSDECRLQSCSPLMSEEDCEGLCIDDYFAMSRESLSTTLEESRANAKIQKALQAYKDLGILGSPEKDVLSDKAKIVGAVVNASHKARDQGLVTVGAPIEKRISLSVISLQLCSTTADELVLASILIPLACSELNAEFSPEVFCSDVTLKSFGINDEELGDQRPGNNLESVKRPLAYRFDFVELFAGSLTKASAMYSNQLADALTEVLEDAIRARALADEDWQSVKVHGLENALTNQVALEAEWSGHPPSWTSVAIWGASLAMAAPLKPRNAGDKLRANIRDLRPPLPSGRPVLKSTEKRREFLFSAFRQWVEGRGLLFSELFGNTYQNIEEINTILTAYGRELYQSGRPLNHFSETINSIASWKPQLRRVLQGAWDLVYTWVKLEPSIHHTAMPAQVLLSFLSVCLAWGWVRFGGCIALAWGGLLRPGELLSAKRCHLQLPSDVRFSVPFILLSILEPKSRRTTVSHTVQSLTFGGNALMNKFLLFGLGGVGVNLDPLAGKTFVVSRFHQAPHHYLKVVHTKLPSKARVYQQTHQWSARNVARHAVPQAKFSYDLSPVEVVISYSPRRWYDYITSVFAIIGGAFTFMSMTSSLLNVASAHFKASIHKLS